METLDLKRCEIILWSFPVEEKLEFCKLFANAVLELLSKWKNNEETNIRLIRGLKLEPSVTKQVHKDMMILRSITKEEKKHILDYIFVSVEEHKKSCPVMYSVMERLASDVAVRHFKHRLACTQ